MPALNDKDLLARLVSFDSVSSKSNAPIAAFICEYLAENAGDTIRIERVEADANARGEGDSDDPKLNLIATCGPSLADNTEQNGLILCGHLDVVPAGEPDWRSDPFRLTETGDMLIARGAADMKGFDALAINLLLEAAQHADALAYPLVVILTCDEEVGSIGAKQLVDHLQTAHRAETLPRQCIIGEPTSLRAVRMHKGHLAIRITVRGTAAHSGSPHLGRNAIEPAGDIIIALRSLREQFERMQLDTSRYFAGVPYPVLNVVTIRGGGAINVIPECCIIDVGIRLMPGQQRDQAVAMVDECVREAAGDVPVNVELTRENPPLLTDESAPLHRAICEMIDQHDSIGVSYASDGGWLSTIGFDCVLFGPGTIEVAHKPNEALPIEEFTRARTMLQQLVDRFCRR